MSWNDLAESWESNPATHEYARSAYACVERLSETYAWPLAGAEVLDFGCGTGLLTERLVPLARRIDCVDVADQMLAVLQRKIAQHGWDQVASHQQISGATGPYDWVVCSSVCSFLDDYPATAAELVGQLRPGGVFVQWDWELGTMPGADQMGLTHEQITQSLVQAGLAGVTISRPFSMTIDGTTMHPLMGVGRKG